MGSSNTVSYFQLVGVFSKYTPRFLTDRQQCTDISVLLKQIVFITLVDLVTRTPSATQSLGYQIGTWLPNPSVVGLNGPLGAGKTCFVQGVAQGLGVPSDTHVTSPAYTLIQEYPIGDRTLIHIDFYRLSTLTGADRMLFEELFQNPKHTIVVEWASKFLSELAPEFLIISILKGPDKNLRSFRISSNVPRYEQLLKKLSEYANTGT